MIALKKQPVLEYSGVGPPPGKRALSRKAETAASGVRQAECRVTPASSPPADHDRLEKTAGTGILWCWTSTRKACPVAEGRNCRQRGAASGMPGNARELAAGRS